MNAHKSITINKNSHVRKTQKLPNNNSQPAFRKEIFVWLFCLLIASALLLIASRASPLYPLNDWVDANTFFTLGKGMMRGRVLYRDLFDHKGPLLYFYYGVASLISYKTFLGVYILECISFSVFLYFCERTLSLFVDRKYALLTLPMLAASIVNLRSFAYGGTAESFIFPLMMAGLFHFSHYFLKSYPESPPTNWGFIHGVIAGCVLWIKYSFLGFWLGGLIILIISSLINKHFKQILKFCALFCAGMFAATLPWVAYFGFNGAISDWIQTYFVINLTTYSLNLSLREIFQVAIDSYQRHSQFNPLAIGLMTLGILVFCTTKSIIKSWWFSLGLLLSIGLLVLGVYAGGKDFIYYFLIFAPLIIWGFIHLSRFYQQSFGKLRSNILFIFLIITTLSLSFGYTFRYNRNTKFRLVEKIDLVQYKFAEIITKSDEPSLLNYGFGDGGFYTTTGIIPNVKYFQQYNLVYGHFPINMEEQNRYIQEKIVDYVIIRYPAGENPPEVKVLEENYQTDTKEIQFFGEQEFIYELLKRK